MLGKLKWGMGCLLVLVVQVTAVGWVKASEINQTIFYCGAVHFKITGPKTWSAGCQASRSQHDAVTLYLAREPLTRPDSIYQVGLSINTDFQKATGRTYKDVEEMASMALSVLPEHDTWVVQRSRVDGKMGKYQTILLQKKGDPFPSMMYAFLKSGSYNLFAGLEAPTNQWNKEFPILLQSLKSLELAASAPQRSKEVQLVEVQ